MVIRFHEKLYRDGLSERKVKSLKKKVEERSPGLRLFLVTLPVNGNGLLEIYWYPELLQKVYSQWDAELVVVGMARSREHAFSLIETIVADVGWQDNSIPVREYFEEHR